ncbi:MAG: poly(R)-hydroxyalkanoic acid synthase subunit PhaE [Syntrophobacteraceae bacterium]
MNSEDQGKKGEGPSLEGWMKSAIDFWLSAASGWPGMSNPRQGSSDSQGTERDDFKTRLQDAWQQPFKISKTLSSIFSDAEVLNAFITGTGAIPDSMMRTLRAGLDGCFKLHQHWLSKLDKSDSGEPYRFENLDEEMFGAWMEIYQKEIQPILNVPPLGLNRFYQERMQQTLDKYHQYQAALAEFMRLLLLPLEKSVRVMEKEIERLHEEGKLSEDFKDYYNMWIKVLEGHYMTLFKSPDYLDSMARMLTAVQEFKMARHKTIADMLQVLPIPTNREMDELYKEIYLLKKQVKQLSSKVETGESSAL